MNITDIAWYVGLTFSITLWALAAVYFMQTIAAIFSVYSKNGHVTKVTAQTTVTRAIITSALVVAGIAVFNLINWMVAQ